MSSSGQSASAGVGFGGLLGIAFIVLKLCGVISWPWLWVLSPIWIPFAIVAVVIFVAGVIASVFG